MGTFFEQVLTAMKNDPKGRGPMYAAGSPLTPYVGMTPDQAYEAHTARQDEIADEAASRRIAETQKSLVNPPAPDVSPVAPPTVSSTTPLVDVFTEQGAGRGRPPDQSFPGGMIPTPGKRPKAMERIDEE